MSKAMSESLSQLLNDYQLTENDCNGAVSDIHLEEISRYYCTGWKSSLPPNLEMREIHVKDIVVGHGDEQEKRHAFLKKWKEVGGSKNATYKKLISALLDTEHRKEAEGVCKLLQKSLSQQSTPIDIKCSEESPGPLAQQSAAALAIECSEDADELLQKSPLGLAQQSAPVLAIDIECSEELPPQQSAPTLAIEDAEGVLQKPLPQQPVPVLAVASGIKYIHLLFTF